MSLWGPVTAAPEVAPDWVAEGAIASCVLTDDMIDEFGEQWNNIDQPLIDKATGRVEDRLNRPLRNAVYQDRLRIVYDGYVDAIFGAAGSVRPRAIPVQQVISPAGTYLVDNGVEIRYVPPDDIMLGFWGYTWIEQWGTVTYQGGYTPNNLPDELRTVILKVAIRMFMRRTPGTQMDVAVPGVNNPRVGDVTYQTGKDFGSLFDTSDCITLKRYKYRGSF